MPAAPPALDERNESLRALFADLGYGDDLVRTRFPVWTDDATDEADIVGFGSAHRHDVSTATIVGGIAIGLDVLAPRHLDLARALAAPVGVIAGPEAMQVWTVGPETTGAYLRAEIEYSGLDATHGRLRAELSPRSLLQAKRATRQLSLFPVDVGLLTRARQQSAARLAALLEDAMQMAQTEVTRPDPLLVSRLVLAASGALMIRDKLGLSAPSASEALALAQASYPKFFGWTSEIDTDAQRALLSVAEVLQRDVNFASVDPTVISEIYESAFVDSETRARLGIHYTPLELARQVMRHLPFEELAPEDRTVLDPACGSGTLLIAAQDRLAQAMPGVSDEHAKQDYARSHLAGYDADPFAAEIARLSLLLNGLPYGDSWAIATQDFLTESSPSRSAPALIVSNPPWKGSRSIEGKRDELADRFVRRILATGRPGSFAAIILPVTWLTSSTSAATRASLLGAARIFEVWRLPEDAFGSSAMAPCVVFAELGERTSRFVFKRVMPAPDWQRRFLVEGRADEVYQGDVASGMQPGTLMCGPLDAYAGVLKSLPTLSAVADVRTGPVPRPGHVPTGKGPYWFLRHARAVRPFGRPAEEDLERVDFPADFHRSGQDVRPFLVPKLLVSAKRTANNPWRLVVRYDDRGVIFRETLNSVRPRSGTACDLYALAAILASSFASCWVDALDAKMSFGVEVLRTLPVPADRAAWRKLGRLGEALLSQGNDGHFHRKTFEDLERAILDAYGLPEEAGQALAAHFARFEAPEGGARFAPLAVEATATRTSRRRYGSVLAVGASGVTLWVQGVTPDEGTTLSTLPRGLLGWLCRPGATFDVDIEGTDLHHATYLFQARSYLELEQLLQPQTVDG